MPDVVTLEQLQAVGRLALKAAPSPVPPSNGTFNVETKMQEWGLEILRSGPYEGGTRYILKECPFNPEHKGSEVAVIRRANGQLNFKCQRASCPGKNWQDLRERFEPGYRQQRVSGGLALAGTVHLREISTNQRMREISKQAIAAITAANNPPSLYRRGSEVVRVDDTGYLHAELVSYPALRGHLDRIADFVKTTTAGPVVPASPPRDLAPDLLSLPAKDFPLPDLRGIKTSPCFAADGRLLDRDGYDPETGLLLACGGVTGVSGVLPAPAEGLHLIDEMLQGFPFGDPGSRAHAIAALLLTFCRELIDGATPLHLIDAPARGTGKGLLADVIGLVATGMHAATMSLPNDEDETEKRITSQLLAGHSVVLLDNVVKLKSLALCMALTTVLWAGRRLGKSEIVHVPNGAVWLATGNNPVLSDEMVRRVAPIRLDAGVERPEERTGFAIPDLPAWVKDHRKELVAACLSLIQAWIDAGRPAGTKTLGRFEAWAQAMGGILDVARVPGFLKNRERLHAEADAETTEWVAACQAWQARHGEAPATAKALHELFKEHDILTGLWAGKSALAGQQRVGHALSQNRDRVFGCYRIRGAGRDAGSHGRTYRLEIPPAHGGKNKTPETPETPETPLAIAGSGAGSDSGPSAADGGFGEIDTANPRSVSGNPRSDGGFDEALAGNPRNGHPRQHSIPGVSTGVTGVSGVLKPTAARDRRTI